MHKYFNISLILLSSFIYAAETEHPTKMDTNVRPKTFIEYLEEHPEMQQQLLEDMIRNCEDIAKLNQIFQRSSTPSNEKKVLKALNNCLGKTLFWPSNTSNGKIEKVEELKKFFNNWAQIQAQDRKQYLERLAPSIIVGYQVRKEAFD